MSNKRCEQVAEFIRSRDAASLRLLASGTDTNQEQMVLLLIADLIDRTAPNAGGTDVSCDGPGAEAAD
jgi:hypothetical protein